jgi:hypothetical protein
MEISDYCGYCGKEFARNEGDPPEVCQSCLNDPDPAQRQRIAEDLEYAEADRQNDEELAYEASKYDDCDRCTNPAERLHPCPYKVEINEDSDTLCDCCPDCEVICRDEI